MVTQVDRCVDSLRYLRFTSLGLPWCFEYAKFNCVGSSLGEVNYVELNTHDSAFVYEMNVKGCTTTLIFKMGGRESRSQGIAPMFDPKTWQIPSIISSHPSSSPFSSPPLCLS